MSTINLQLAKEYKKFCEDAADRAFETAQELERKAEQTRKYAQSCFAAASRMAATINVLEAK